MRVYIDKLRDYKEAQITIPIATDYDRGRFYDKLRTLELFNDNNIEKPKQDEKEKPEKLKRFKKY